MPVLLLGLLVVLAGLAIGGLAGRLTAMHAHLPTSVPSISPVPTETPTLAPVSTPTPKTTPTPKPTPSPKTTATPRTKPSPSASPVPSVTPSAEPSATPKPVAKAAATPRATPRTVEKKQKSPAVRKTPPSASPAPAIGGAAARAVVRVYLADLARGDSAGAGALLASGSPDTFIDGTLQIGSVASVPTANGAQSVTAQIIVGVKHYTMTFLVGERSGRAVILSHAATSATPALP
ncbi:MAG: hypothetical protein ACP5O6_05740 [Candidatus Baltobacteraceae bacterium]